jgi:hypothetical protein
VEAVFQVKGLESSDPSQAAKELELGYSYGRRQNSANQELCAEQLRQRFHSFCVSTR